MFFISRRFSQILSADFRGFFLCFFLRISFLADSRGFDSLIFADFFYFLFFADVYFISRGCFFMLLFLRISFLADSRGFYSLIFADFISRGWFFMFFNLYFYEISIWIFWVIRLVDPKHGIQFFVSYVFDIVSVPNRHVYISWF